VLLANASFSPPSHRCNASTFTPTYAGALHERKIRAILMQKEFVITGAGPLVHIWKRGKAVRLSLSLVLCCAVPCRVCRVPCAVWY
jgi:hypothetical protein